MTASTVENCPEVLPSTIDSILDVCYRDVMANAHAHYQTNKAYLSQSFGRSLVQLWFGFDNDILEAIVGRYSRGKRKNQFRGAITWTKCIRGGWSGGAPGEGGFIMYPGQIFDVAIIDAFTGETIYYNRSPLNTRYR